MWDTVLSTQEQQVLNLLDEMRPELLDCLQALIRFDTSNPPGFNERRAQDWIAERVSSLGMSVDLFDVLPGRPDLVAQLTGLGEGRSFLFNGHVDVAELNDPGAWNHPPFGGEIEDGCLYGLGASDMKGAHAGFLLALECIRRAGYRFKGNVIYESVVGEETGEPGTRQCLERGITADFALVGEPSGARAIFVASVGTVNACITVRDSITRHVIQRREMIRAGGQLSAANCIDVIATRIIPGLLQLEQEWGVHKVHPMLDPGQAMINIFHIEGGGNASMVPSECRAYITVVYLPDEHREDVKAEVEDRVRAICASDRWLTQHPPQIEWSPARFPLEFLPMNGSADEPGAALLAQCLRDVSQRSAFVGGRGAVNDAGWFYQAGVPTAVFGPGDRWVIHQPDEHVAVEDLVIYSKTLALFLLRWCGVAEMPQQ